MNIALDPLAIATAKHCLSDLMKAHAACITYFSLADALQWLEMQLPTLRDADSLLIWANATEQLARELTSEQTLWQQALQTEGYTLRLRARALPPYGTTYTA